MADLTDRLLSLGTSKQSGQKEKEKEGLRQ